MSALQEVLKMSIQVQAPAGSEFQQMSEGDKKWLSGALNSMAKHSTDLAREMKKRLETISVLFGAELDAEKMQEITDILEEIAPLVDDLDLAQNFVQMGGHDIMLKCLQHKELIEESCEVLAGIAQNNPKVQQTILEANMIPIYLSLLTDQNLEESIKKKVLYALSCLCRGFQPATLVFRAEKGVYKLTPFIENLDSLLATKAVFLIKSLINEDISLKQEVLTSGLLEILVNKLREPRKPTHEHILSLLSTCLTEHDNAVAFCKQQGIGLLNIVKEYEEQEGIYQEEKEACKNIVLLLA